MVIDSLSLKNKGSEPMYVRLYNELKSLISSGSLPKGEKLPSIRGLSEQLGISRTTVDQAYAQLCVEGYIEGKSRSGYYVCIDGELSDKRSNGGETENRIDNEPVRYDFSSSFIDSRLSDKANWSRHIRYIVSDGGNMETYSHPQGEAELRKQLSLYSCAVRGVNAPADSIVVGAGLQTLLTLLCGLMHCRRVAFQSDIFEQAEQIFEDFGIEIVRPACDTSGFIPAELDGSGAECVFLNVSGRPMPVTRRKELLRWAAAHNAYIIEDDYNGELRYKSRPVPAIQGIDKSGRVIYIGSFSKVLMPSVRLSYMVLPDELLRIYCERRSHYNQTASRLEQLALARYLHSGELQRHLRRLRRSYAEKAAELERCAAQELPYAKSILLHETALKVEIILAYPINERTLSELLTRGQVRASAMRVSGSGTSIILSFAGIALEDIAAGIHRLAETIEGMKE